MATETFGQRLRRLRQKYNISQDQVAEALRTTRQTVSNWENDKCAIDYFSLQDLKVVLCCDWKDLMEDEDKIARDHRGSVFSTMGDQEQYLKECHDHGIISPSTNISTLSKAGLYRITSDDFSVAYKLFAYFPDAIMAIAKEMKEAGFTITLVSWGDIWVKLKTDDEAKRLKKLFDDMHTNHYEHAARYRLTSSKLRQPLREAVREVERQGIKEIFGIKGDKIYYVIDEEHGGTPLGYVGDVEEAKKLAEQEGVSSYFVREI
ncbi:helix-turn-helix transcriptional regulator [Candidatus Saccharibacteria bacterium]|nr:helix-turn-helix transcriptional regulator [Candidatus Saccharibacteria bacterium]